MLSQMNSMQLFAPTLLAASSVPSTLFQDDPHHLIAHATELTIGIPDLLYQVARLYRGGVSSQLSHQGRLAYTAQLSELRNRHADLKRHNDFVTQSPIQLIELHPETYTPALESIDAMWDPLSLRSLRECVVQRGETSPVPAMLLSAARTFKRPVSQQLSAILKAKD